MYLEHFGLRVNPFGISPRLDFLYKSGAFEEGMAHLVYGLENSEAIVMITGAIGTGKTMAVQSFLSYLGDRYLSALITNTSVDGRELLKLILDDLECPQPSQADKSDLLIAFKQFLIAAGKQGKRIIVVIDEAQNLSRAVLEEVRLLTNLGQGQEQPVQIILVGQPELEAAVSRPDLAQLRQRIRVHCRLTPLTRVELDEYVDHRMQVAGGQKGVFSRAALDAIYEVSGGVPRIVNSLCEQALLAAYVVGRKRVEAADLSESPFATSPVSPASPTVPDKTVELPRQIPLPEPAPRPEHVVRPQPKLAHPVPMAEQRRPDAGPRRGGRGAGRRARTPALGSAAWLTIVAALVIVLLAVWKRHDLQSLVARVGAPSQQPATENSGPDPSGVHQDLTTSQVGDVTAVPDSAESTVSEVTDEPLGDEKVADTSNRVVDAARVAQPSTRPVAVDEAASRPAAGAATATATAVVTDQPCYLHVSSFRTAGHAEAVAGRFAAAGQNTLVREHLVRDVRWYRVYLGPFENHDEAVRQANELRAAGTISYYKVTSPGDGDGP